MALVDDLLPVLLAPADPPYPDDLLTRASTPGRLRDAVLGTWQRLIADPRRAGGTLRTALREARHLHSRERRLAADALYDLVRHHQVLGAVAGETPEALLDGWIGVQRGALDLQEAARPLLAARPAAEALALAGSVPLGFAEALLATPIDAPAFLAASNGRGPLALRVNRLRADRETVLGALAAAGIDARPSEVARDGVVVLGAVNLQALDVLKQGLVEVQDEASQVLADLVGAQPGERVADVCAGAGGKTLALAAAMEGRGRILAADVRDHALRELRRRARRAGASDVLDVRRIPAEGPLDLPGWTGRAERVLVDAPCSGSGTLRRDPAIRWRLDGATIQRMAALQRAILERSLPLLAPGGHLVYSTCSVLRVEDEDVVEGLLADHPELEAVGAPIRLSPHADGTDGFFGAVIRGGDAAERRATGSR